MFALVHLGTNRYRRVHSGLLGFTLERIGVHSGLLGFTLERIGVGSFIWVRVCSLGRA